MARYSAHFYETNYLWVTADCITSETCFFCKEPVFGIDYTPPPRMLKDFTEDAVRVRVCKAHWYQIYFKQKAQGNVPLTFGEKARMFRMSGIRDVKVHRGLYNLRAPSPAMAMPDLDSVIINTKRYTFPEAILIHLMSVINDSDLDVSEIVKVLSPHVKMPLPLEVYADMWVEQ